jgi:hypothetical protein
MNPRWQLAIYRPGEDRSTQPVGAYLDQRQSGSISWTPHLYESSIFMEIEGREWIAENFNLGILGRLVLQFEAAAPRVEAKDIALIRSAEDSEWPATYLVFEPAGEEVRISLFSIDDGLIGAIYPISKIPGETGQLYGYVRKNLDRFTKPGTEGYYEFRSVPFPRDALVTALRAEAVLGRRLYDLLGEEISW